MKKRHLTIRSFEQSIFKTLMLLAFGLVVISLGFILFTIIIRGLPALNLAMLTQTPKGGYYLGKEGGILNAIVGSIYLAGGGTFLALLFSLPLALFLQAYAGHSSWARLVRLGLDVLWGIPSIVYGAFGFTLMLALGIRASLLGGILVLALLELPILTRAMDEVIRMMPVELGQASFALGANRFETAIHVIARQIVPGIVTGVLLAFGRGIGDAASVLFTAGYTDRLPTSLLRPAASLPLAVFFQLGTPYPEVQQRAYAAALVLTIIVLALSLGARWLAGRMGKNIVR
jgi:phosphate transport system permease protein